MTLDVYTVGGLPWITQALKGIVLIIGDSAYHTALRVTLLWAIVIGTITAIRRAHIFPLSHLIVSFFLFHGFYSAKVDVNVIDTKLGQNYVVTDVPFGVGVVTSMFSMLGHTLSNLIDTAFHTGTVIVYGVNNSYVSDIDYEKTGYLGTIDYFTRVKSIAFGDPETYQRVEAYVKQCFIPYVSTLSESELNTILKEKDLYGSGRLEVPINLIMKYDGQSWYCKDFYQNMLVPKVNDFLSNAISTPSLIGFASSGELQKYKTVINALTNASYSVTSAVSQPAVINAIKTALIAYSSDSDEFNRQVLSSYLVGEAEGKFQLMAKSIGDLAKDLIPSLAIAMQFLIIVASSTIALLFLLPQALNAFWRYVKLSAWVYFWSPALATLDALTKVGIIYKMHSILLLTNTNGLTIASVGKALSEADNIAAIGGYLALSVPGIAWLLLQGSEYVVASLAQGIMGRATQGVTTEEMVKASTAEKVGYEATGTIGEGFRVRSALFANPTSMAHAFGSAVAGASSAVLQGSYLGGITDTAMGAGAGMATYKAHGGSISAMMETGALTKGVRAYSTDTGILYQKPNIDGIPASQNLEAKYGGNLFSAQLTDSYRKALSERLSETYQQLRTLTTESTQTLQAGYREFSKFTDAVINQYQDGAKYSQLLETSESRSLKEMRQIRDNIARALDISNEDATQITKGLIARLSFDANFRKAFGEAIRSGKILSFIKNFVKTISPGLEDKIDVSKIDIAKLTESARELSEFSKSQGFELVLSAVTKLAKDDSIAHSFISNYQHDTGKSIDMAKLRSYSEKVASSVHKALNYSKEEQHLLERGTGFSIDRAQLFIEWYAERAELTPERAHELLNSMAKYQPLQLEALADEFSQEILDNKWELHPEQPQGKLPDSKFVQDFYKEKLSEIENLSKAKDVDSTLHKKLRESYETASHKFTKNFTTTRTHIDKGKSNISEKELNSFETMKSKLWELSPEEAQHLLNTSRLKLLNEYTSSGEKAAWLGSSAISLASSPTVWKKAAEATKWLAGKPTLGLVTAAIAAEGALIHYENQRYIETELQKMAEAEVSGKVKTITSLDDLSKGEVGVIQKGNYTFEVIKEPARFGLSPQQAIAAAHGADISTYTVVAKGPDSKPQVFVLSREEADRLINEGRTPGWIEIGGIHIGSDSLPGYKVDN